MSKFFRSGNSDSSDSTTTSDSESNSDDVNHGENLTREGTSPRNEVARTVPTTTSNKDLLLHALLEERCRNDVRQDATRRGLSLDESELTLQARTKYQSLSAELARLGVIDDEPAGQDRAPIRAQVLRGLELLSQSPTPVPDAFQVTPAPSRLLIDAGPQVEPSAMRELVGSKYLTDVQLDLASNAQQAAPSRYLHEFEEIDLIGKGGYGSVYACRHRLDNVIYAVKKVALPSPGPVRYPPEVSSETDTVLNEVRMLARLDHPNIVRYHAGWIDWVNASGRVFPVSDATGGADAVSFSAGASLGRIITETDTDESHITFEHSNQNPGCPSSADDSHVSTTSSDGPHRQLMPRDPLYVSAMDDTTHAEGIASKSRSFNTGSEVTGSDGPAERINGPYLALHIQMALYPMNLAVFLTPLAHAPQSLLCHCFHVRPSVRILLAIIDGVDYLHLNNVVHRDLKPGNVFLEACTNRYADGSVDLFDCPTCLHITDAPTVGGAEQQHHSELAGASLGTSAESSAIASNAYPTTTGAKNTAIRRLRVRIGDFGLAQLRTSGATGTHSLDVGTALYQPSAIPHPHSPQLDIYALGIIAFELVWPFATRMERHTTLSAVKVSVFPQDFDAQMGDGGKLRNCIDAMLTDSVIALSEVRRRLQQILD
ncbi:hypothetical protein B0A48_04894 [Cryoendolithus antarcticus]|uniref:Uncharacterized protein n=1 Tax=Cryoendolithus antarcticus TaxID=1507870 RepID=A0A1V8TDN8_9PEZI|nr:hypothetical protein B0A48_04894 [Cryoendolithus antarcticus]